MNRTKPVNLHSVACFRSPNANAKDEEHTGGDVSSAAKSSKSNDAETLISQMHDLSFMLKSELSVPSKN